MAMMLLAGCVQVPSEAIVRPACPTIKTYTAAEQKQVSDEIVSLPQDAETRVFIRDYGALRDQVRACRSIGTNTSK